MKKKEDITMEKAREALRNKDYAQAKKLFEELDKQGDVTATFNLAIMHVKGDALEADPRRAEALLLAASEQGYSDADYHLGIMYKLGLVGEKKQAEECFKKYINANQYNHEGCYYTALYHLGVMYAEGCGVARNIDQALSLLKQAARKCKEAQFYLGGLFATGNSEIARNPEKAMRYILHAGKEPEGCVAAQYSLGIIYRKGTLCDKNDVEARKYFSYAAKKDHRDAQYRLARMCLNGWGGSKNEVEAIEWFAKAANQGHRKAQAYLKYYANTCGIGTENTSKKVPGLIKAVKDVLGDSYAEDLDKMFHELWHQGIPLLKDGAFYHYEYQFYLSGELIPVNKQANTVYLYIEDGVLHYQVLKQLELCTGTLIVSEDFNLDRLKSVSFRKTVPLSKDIRQIYYSYNTAKTACIYEAVADNGDHQVGITLISLKDTEEEIQKSLLTELAVRKYCLDEKEHLETLKKALHAQLIESGHFEPSYEEEFSKKTANKYNEILELEKKILAFFSNLIFILENAEFKEVFKNPEKFRELSAKYITPVKQLCSDQQEVVNNLKLCTSSAEVIGVLSSAYKGKINFENYSAMVNFIQSLYLLMEESPITIKEKVESFCITYSSQLSLSASQVLNLPVTFTAQFVTRRILLLKDLSTYFRRSHDKFYELDTLFFTFNKLATIANRALPQSCDGGLEKNNLEVVYLIQSKLEKEKNKSKAIFFELIKPPFRMLVLQADLLNTQLILQRFPHEKGLLVNGLVELKKWVENNFLPDISFVSEIERITTDVMNSNDLAHIIACITNLLTLIHDVFPQMNLDNNLESSVVDFFKPEQEIKILSLKDKERRSSRPGNILGLLSPRRGQALLPLDTSLRESVDFDDIQGKKKDSAVAPVDDRSSLEDNRTKVSPPQGNDYKTGENGDKDSNARHTQLMDRPYHGRFSSPLSSLRADNPRPRSILSDSYSGPLRNLADNAVSRKKGHSALSESYHRRLSHLVDDSILPEKAHSTPSESCQNIPSNNLIDNATPSLPLESEIKAEVNRLDKWKKGTTESHDSIKRPKPGSGPLMNLSENRNSSFSPRSFLPVSSAPVEDQGKINKIDNGSFDRKSGKFFKFPSPNRLSTPRMGSQSKPGANVS